MKLPKIAKIVLVYLKFLHAIKMEEVQNMCKKMSNKFDDYFRNIEY